MYNFLRVPHNKVLDLYGFEKKRDYFHFLGIPCFKHNKVTVSYNGQIELFSDNYFLKLGNIPCTFQIDLRLVLKKKRYKVVMEVNVNNCYKEYFECDLKLLDIYKDVLKKKLPFGIFFDYLKDNSEGEIGKM